MNTQAGMVCHPSPSWHLTGSCRRTGAAPLPGEGGRVRRYRDCAHSRALPGCCPALRSGWACSSRPSWPRAAAPPGTWAHQALIPQACSRMAAEVLVGRAQALIAGATGAFLLAGCSTGRLPGTTGWPASAGCRVVHYGVGQPQCSVARLLWWPPSHCLFKSQWRLTQ